jgi:SAM-dependent methyltransferase
VDFDQTRYPIDLAEMVAWIATAGEPGARVLEIGCGDGAVTNALANLGYDVLGVDPNATPGSRVRAVPFEQLDEPPFDLVFASVSLHHLGDASAASRALRRLTKPGSRMLVREFNKDLVGDPATLEWYFHQLRAQSVFGPLRSNSDINSDNASSSERNADEPQGHEHGEHGDGEGHMHLDHHGHGQNHQPNIESLAAFRDHWTSMMDQHVFGWDTVLHMLESAGFVTEQMETTPYLYRWELQEALRPLEEQLSAQGKIKQVGICWSGIRSK